MPVQYMCVNVVFVFLCSSWCAWWVLFLCPSLCSALLLALLWKRLMGVVMEDTADAPAAHHPAISSPTYTRTSLPDPVGSLNQLQWETPATSNHLWNFSVLLILFSQSRLRLPALSLNPVCPPASPTSSLEPERNHQPDATRTPAAQTSTWSVQIFHKFLYLTSTLVCVSVRGPQTWQ